MGNCNFYKCENCDYYFLDLDGYGRDTVKDYHRILSDIKSGKLGIEYQTFFEENPEGMIDISRQSYRCVKCGNLESTEKLSLNSYIDNRTKRNCRRIVASRQKLFSDFESEMRDASLLRSCFPKYFKEVLKYQHKCNKCGGVMEAIVDFSDVRCPECGGRLLFESDGCWD